MIPSVSGNLICAIDFETTGTEAGWHEIIQIAVVPLDAELNIAGGIKPFYRLIAPDYPERADHDATRVHQLDINDLIMHAPSQEQVQHMFVEWLDSLGLSVGRGIEPLAHNWPFEHSFLREWLGHKLSNEVFRMPRDSMIAANYLNDQAIARGNPTPFKRLGLAKMANYFGILNEHPHDAYHDAITEAKVYKHLIERYPAL